MHRSSGVLGCCTVAVAMLVGCGGSDLVLPSDGFPAELRVLGGNNQIGSAGSQLALPLEVLVADDQGTPLAGHTVTFTVGADAPGARVEPETVRSGSDGVASTSWLLGATAGSQTVLARVERPGSAEPLEVSFSAMAAAAGAQQLAIVGGNDQSAPAGSRLADPLAVLVTDAFGNPVAGVSIQWSAQGGSVDPASSVTGSNGIAETSWTLGTSTGSQSATAASDGLGGSPVTFTATAFPGSASRLVLVSGNNQSGAAGAELPDPLVVLLLDEGGNGVPDRAVSWVVATGGGTVSAATSTTDADGQASTRWTLGPDPGQNTLNAVVSGVGVIAFAATGTGPGGGGGGGSQASRLDFVVQPSDTEEGETMSPSVQVAVLDQAGRVVTDREFDIKLELLDEKDRVRADGTVTTRSGIATFSIRIDRRGDYRLRASTDGLPAVESDEFEVEDD